MDIEKTLREPENAQFLIQGYFINNNLLTKLAIYPNQLYLSNSKLSCTYQINFDFSYDIVKQEHGWLLSLRIPEQVQFFSYIELDSWEDILIKTIRRRRFHQFYQGIRKIGKGNFASVYLSKRISDGKLFAVKAFQKQSTFKPKNGKQALQNQINILRKLSHTNIIHLESVFQTQNSIYLIMELINGKSLGQILDEGKIIAPSLRKKILKGIIAGLAQMETHHILHRDIKPENIMVDSNGEVKIIDFGLATQTQATKYLYVRCGTPGYVAPEIITIQDIQQARMTTISDVFSAGVLFYQMIYGKALFQGQTKTQILKKNRKCLFSIPTFSDLASFQQLIILRRMLDIYPHTRITASQALRLNYFQDKRESLKQINRCQQDNQFKTAKCLPKLKNSTALTERPRRRNKVQQLNENKIN